MLNYYTVHMTSSSPLSRQTATQHTELGGTVTICLIRGTKLGLLGTQADL